MYNFIYLSYYIMNQKLWMGGGVAGARLADVVVHAEVVVGQEKGDVTAQLLQMEAQNVPEKHPNRQNVIQNHAVCVYSIQ